MQIADETIKAMINAGMAVDMNTLKINSIS